ncbi:SDR family oxidoreductase [Rathayibacter sp. KR2-224]|uniref:SDR family oxidoreductase n=1 Tax=Rathayibacter sp. KR2-224 TaxID=3400913 RepID=UPI003C051517
MRVFVTGATGFVGNHLVADLMDVGHDVVGLSRSESGAKRLTAAGVTAFVGNVNDLPRLRLAVQDVDAVVHTAFDHERPDSSEPSEDDRKVITALGDVFAGTNRPIIVASGTGLVQSTTGGPVVESDRHAPSSVVARGASEEAAEALLDKGLKVMVVRLPQVHDIRRQGRLRWHIEIARDRGYVAYIGEGGNRVPAVHVTDAARLFRLALEHGSIGARYHAVAEEGVTLRAIAEAIGNRLHLPVRSLAPEDAPEYFGWLAQLAGLDLPASGTWTAKQLGWRPTGPGLLDDLRNAEDDGA